MCVELVCVLMIVDVIVLLSLIGSAYSNGPGDGAKDKQEDEWTEKIEGS